jgi:hypothetical protein
MFFSDNFEDLASIDIMMQLFDISRKYKRYDIQPRGCGTSELNNDNPFIKEILWTSIEL